MSKIISIFLVFQILLFNFVTPINIFAAESKSSINEKRLEQLEIIRERKKIDIDETIRESEKNQDRYVIFTQSENYNTMKNTVREVGGVFSVIDKTDYDGVKAIPVDISYMSKNEKKEFFDNLNSNEKVLAVTPVAKREISEVPSFNDPLYPTDLSYDNAKQWYLSQPSNGNYGIDILRAWQHLDSLGKSYGGNSDVLVAIVDTGGAFETFEKYHEYEKMSSPISWRFTKSTDFTDNIFQNDAETPQNQIDEDGFNLSGYCLDNNGNMTCDTGEIPSVFDDYNSFNVIDWNNYWSRISFSEYSNAPVCTNEPYHTNGIRCISNYSNTSNCTLNGLSNYLYYGCFKSDMGHANDVHGHGTFISNIISAKANNGIAGVGIAPNISLLNIKVFGEYYDSFRSKWVYDSAYGDQIAAAINYAVDKGVDIINMSFAGDTIDLYEKMAMDNAYYEKGILLVAASGNSGTSAQNYPAGYESVMSVGASQKTGIRTSYSSYGNKLDLVAPVGSGIVSQGMWDTVNNRSITANCSWNSSMSCMNVDPFATPSPFATFANLTSSGTSFAAPQVVAVAALIKSTYPNITASQIRYILSMSSSPTGSLSNSSYVGHGVLNAYNSVRAVDYRGNRLSKIKRIYQSTLNSNGYIQTRYSDEMGSDWSNWIQSGNVKSYGLYKTIALPTNSEKVVQVMKGSNNGVYTRYAENYGYINPNDSSWSGWIFHGYTSGAIYVISSGNNIVLSWKGTNGRVYTRYTSNASTWSWAASSPQIPLGNVIMVNDPNSNKLLQVIRSTNYYIYTRTSSDNGANWSAWKRSPDRSLTDPSVIYTNNRMVIAIRNYPYNYIVTRYSNDGGVNWTGRARTYSTSGLTLGSISMIYIPESGYILQSYRGTNNRIYTRYSSNNGVSWSTQTEGRPLPSGLVSSTLAYTANMGGEIIQMIKSSDGLLRFRRSTNNGLTWTNWTKTGSIAISGGISIVYDKDFNRLYVNVIGQDRRQYSRMSDDKGRTFTSWSLGGTIKSTINTAIVEMQTIDLSN